MTAQQLIKLAIFKLAQQFDSELVTTEPITSENIDEIFEEVEYEYGAIQDAKNEFRCSGTPSNIPAPSSRHYEADSVYDEIEGQFVGWIYWHGGGKFGEPEAIDWIEDAYLLKVTKEINVIRREFEVIEQN